MIKTTLNAVIIAAIMGLVYLNEFQGIGYAGNLAFFILWVFIFIGLFVFIVSIAVEAKKTEPASKPSKVTITMQALLVCLLATAGWFVTASAYFLVMILLYAQTAVKGD